MPLRINTLAEYVSGNLARGKQALAFHSLRHGKPYRVENRRREIQQASRRVDSLRQPSSARRPVNDQRHPQRALIDEKTMRRLTVVSQSLAVIGGKDDERLIHQIVSSEIVPEISDHVVDITQLSVITPAVFRLLCCGQVIRCVQVVEVKEEKKRSI